MGSNTTEPRLCERCLNDISDRRRDSKYCSHSCQVLASRKRKKEEKLRAKLVTITESEKGSVDGSHESDTGDLLDLYERTQAPAADYADAGPAPTEDDLRFYRAIEQQDISSAPGPDRRAWRKYEKRHHTKHPEELQYRIDQARAKGEARTQRFESRESGLVEDRHNPRSIGNVAASGQRARKLNERRAEHAPRQFGQDFDFTGNQTIQLRPGDRSRGPRAGYSDYAWNMQDGFFF